jgi:16S rRNA processing protein RimM
MTVGYSGNPQPRYLLVGEVLRPHGILGELRVRVLTAYPERLVRLKTIYIGRDIDAPDVKPYRLTKGRLHQEYALLKLEGINDRTQAEAFRQMFIMVAIEDAVPLDEGEIYLYQLIGLTVITDTGEKLGSITEVLETGANDVYIVDSPQYGEILIPITPETHLKTDTQAGVVIVKLPDGLLPQR